MKNLIIPPKLNEGDTADRFPAVWNDSSRICTGNHG